MTTGVHNMADTRSQPAHGPAAGRRPVWQRAASWLWWRVLTAWRRVFQHRSHVFVHDTVLPDRPLPTGFVVTRYATVAELPPDVVDELTALRGDVSVAADQWEMRRGAVLWLGRLDGQVATLLLSRAGRHYRKWFLPLRPHDIVVFRFQTLPVFRGRGLIGALLAEVLRQECSGDARAHTDCRVWNTASRRAIEKAGFRHVATMRPVPLAEQHEELPAAHAPPHEGDSR
jgi:GNAT superfamily N-acetyltransferase